MKIFLLTSDSEAYQLQLLAGHCNAEPLWYFPRRTLRIDEVQNEFWAPPGAPPRKVTLDLSVHPLRWPASVPEADFSSLRHAQRDDGRGSI